MLLTVKFSKWVAGGTIQGKVGLASCEVKKNRMSSVCLCRLLVEDPDDVEVVTEVDTFQGRSGQVDPDSFCLAHISTATADKTRQLCYT